MKLICITNNIPDTVYEMLKELEFTSITFSEINSTVPAKLKTDAIFLMTYNDFKSTSKS
jgi:prephenate dehydratase